MSKQSGWGLAPQPSKASWHLAPDTNLHSKTPIKNPPPRPTPFPLPGLEGYKGRLTLGEYFSPLKGSLGLTSPVFSLLSVASTTSFSSGLLDPWLPWLGLTEGEEPFPPSGKKA